MQLSEQQLNHFETFGFLVFPQLLSSAEMERYSEEFDAGMAAWLDGEEFDGRQRHYATLMEEASPFIAGLADDPRFGDAAEQLFGREGIAIAVDGSYMVGDTRWHPDTASLDYRGIKFCIYSDRLGRGTGALRVIPGSHREPLHGLIAPDPGEAYGIPPEELPAHVFESEPGDVLAFDVGAWHASFGGAAGRRQGVIVYYEDPETPAAAGAVVSQMRGNHQIFAGRKRRMYGDHWRSLPGRRRQRWLRRLDELGVLDTPTETDRKIP
ncbi:MAG: phytanoyl-CoA dioxygenase family protein [Gemmatimonadetes bacterium]|nr:phytanoyl-CoA dioxygenase family protein [Gemmatimonadota bacterium]